jgi:sulfur carrier protein ThiS
MTRRRRTASVIRVTIVPIGGEVKEVALKEDSTIREAVVAAGFSSSVEVMDNSGEALNLDDVAENGDEITILSEGKIEGGR